MKRSTEDAAQHVVVRTELVGAWVEHEAVDAALKTRAGGSGIILDVRNAPGCAAAVFEVGWVRLHKALYGRFRRVVTLVRSSLGALQATRLARQFGLVRWRRNSPRRRRSGSADAGDGMTGGGGGAG